MKINSITSAIKQFQNTGQTTKTVKSETARVNKSPESIDNRMSKLLSAEEKNHFKEIFPGVDFAYGKGATGISRNKVENKSVGLGRYVDIKA